MFGPNGLRDAHTAAEWNKHHEALLSPNPPTPTPALPNRLSHRGLLQAQIGISEREEFSLRIALAPDFALGRGIISRHLGLGARLTRADYLIPEHSIPVRGREGWRPLRTMGKTRKWVRRTRSLWSRLQLRLYLLRILHRHFSTTATRPIDLRSVSQSPSSFTPTSHDQLWSLQTILIFVFAIAALFLVVGALVWRSVLAPYSLLGVCSEPLLTNDAMYSVDEIDTITSANTTSPCVPSSHQRHISKIDRHYPSTSLPPLTLNYEHVPASIVSHSPPSPFRLSPTHVPVEQATPYEIAHEDRQERVEPILMSGEGDCLRMVLARRISYRHMGRRLLVEGCRCTLSWRRWSLDEEWEVAERLMVRLGHHLKMHIRLELRDLRQVATLSAKVSRNRPRRLGSQ